MKVLCLDTFLDGTERFEKGDVRTVDDGRGVYFCANGWAQKVEEPVSLDIHNSTITPGDSNG